MGLTEQAQEDFAQITGNLDDFGVSLILTSPDNVTAPVIGFHTKHHFGINEIGQSVNSKKASVAFAESNLPAGFNVRITDPNHPLVGEVNLKNYKVDVSDSTGQVKNYKAMQWFQDEKIGAIVIILTDYANAD